jgi:cytochrome c oxidase cbb3-type subunit 3
MSNEENKVEVFEDEKALLLNSNYDGIHELNHPLPMWWVVIFIGTIVFSIPYYFYYTHMNGPSLKQELEADLKTIYENQAAFAAKQGSFNVDEYNAFVSTEAAQKDGAKTYKRKCKACHGEAGEGGIGPNLTDMFWINGDGSIPSLYSIVDKGVTDKGMPAWGPELGKEKVMAVVDYIAKLKGTNPANPKAPQGTKYE